MVNPKHELQRVLAAWLAAGCLACWLGWPATWLLPGWMAAGWLAGWLQAVCLLARCLVAGWVLGSDMVAAAG